MTQVQIPPEIEKLSFEDALSELEKIVRRLEEGKGKLDEAIKAYERVGFRVEGRDRAAHWARGRAVDFLAMSILREEFDARYGVHDGWVTEAVDATA